MKLLVSQTSTGTTTARYEFHGGCTFQAIKSGTVTDYDVVFSNDGGTTLSNHSVVSGASATASGQFDYPVGNIGVRINTGTGTVALHVVGL